MKHERHTHTHPHSTRYKKKFSSEKVVPNYGKWLKHLEKCKCAHKLCPPNECSHRISSKAANFFPSCLFRHCRCKLLPWHTAAAKRLWQDCFDGRLNDILLRGHKFIVCSHNVLLVANVAGEIVVASSVFCVWVWAAIDHANSHRCCTE